MKRDEYIRCQKEIYFLSYWKCQCLMWCANKYKISSHGLNSKTDTGFQLCLLVCEHTEAHLQHGVKEHSRKVQMLWIGMYRFICPTFFLLTGGRVIKGWKTLKQWVIYLFIMKISFFPLAGGTGWMNNKDKINKQANITISYRPNCYFFKKVVLAQNFTVLHP